MTALASAIPEIWMGPPKLTRSSAMAEGLRDALVSIEKNLQSINDLDIHPRSSQLLLLNGLFVDCCFYVFI